MGNSRKSRATCLCSQRTVFAIYTPVVGTVSGIGYQEWDLKDLLQLLKTGYGACFSWGNDMYAVGVTADIGWLLQ